MFRTFTAALLIAASFSTTAMAGAFGINMGDTAKDLKILRTLRKKGAVNTYQVEPPVRNPEFETYMVFVNDQTGVCQVAAYSGTFMNDPNGGQVWLAFDKVRKILSAKYGEGNLAADRIDAYKSGDRTLADTLYNDDGAIAANWDFDASTPGDISSIMLSIYAKSATSTAFFVGYGFKNVDDCTSTLNQAGDSGL